MTRPLRVDFPGALHHVMNRSAKGRLAFKSDDSCTAFCDLLGESVKRYSVRIHGFALMPNHYHLMVESVHGNLSHAMAYLNGKFTQVVNRGSNKDGSVFRGRFHNRVVTDPGHWRYLLAYLHLNPVRSQFAIRINQWRWTSHRFYNGVSAAPNWLTTEPLSEEYGGIEGYQRYLKAIRQGRRERPDGFDQVLFGGRRSSELPIFKQNETSRKLKAEEALNQVLKVSMAEEQDLFREVSGRGGNPVRTIAAWWLVFGAGLKNGAVAGILKMSPVSVSHAISRVRRETRKSPRGIIAGWASGLNEKNG